MTDHVRLVGPGPHPRTVRAEHGEVLKVPADWMLLPPGDPALTGRVKKSGPCFAVIERRGRKTFSHGVWAPADVVEAIRADLARERADPAYARKLESGQRRRAELQTRYEDEFTRAVFAFLAFAPEYTDLATKLANAISAHAVPVGSGTVARTQRISVERRAEAATIAWLRHATTAYDGMRIPRVKGMRREVRRMLAEQSRRLLDRYRRGEPIAQAGCVLRRGLERRVASEAR